MKFYTTKDQEFKQFGKLVNLDTDEIIETAQKIERPVEGSAYIASCPEFEELSVAQKIQNEFFGGLDVQIGYCHGHNNKLNAVEWHKCSEINIAVTDLVLLLGDVRDIEDTNEYDSSKIKAFIIKKGEAVEIYATTLHFCPIETTHEGFGCVVGLTKGTNTDIDFVSEDKLLFRKNKWIIAHKDNDALIKKGVVGGIYGTNYEINF